MNKTIIININGIVFHIEEDAYEVLKNYMTDVKRHFIDSADSLEITTDIENRIAEMFNEIMARDSKQVVVEQDVRSVISQMGTIEDFASVDEDGNPTPGQPASPYAFKSTDRRLFRDPDDHLLGGVCSGIANYFDVKTIWIRLAFVLITFAFFTGVLVYIILWLVVPRATSRADRMAMKGEPLDLQGFKRNFEYELKNVQDQAAALHKDVRPLAYKTRDFVSDFFDHLGRFLGIAGKGFFKLLGVLTALSCVGLLIALTISVFTFFAFGNTGISHVFPFNTINHDYNTPFMFGGYFTLALPLFAIILLIVRLVFKRDTINRSVGFSILILWIGAVCMVTYYTATILADFRSEGKISQTFALKPSADGSYHLQLNDIKYLSKQDSERLDIKHNFIGKTIMEGDDDDDMDQLRDIRIEIERGGDKAELVETLGARGRDEEDALSNARNVDYHFSQDGSMIKFDRHLNLVNDKKWRNPEVRIILRLPMFATVTIDRDLRRYINNNTIYDCMTSGKNDDQANTTFTMTDRGLQCPTDTVAKAPADSLQQQQ